MAAQSIRETMSESVLVTVPDLWQQWSLKERRGFLKTMVETIALARGKEPIAERTRIALKKGQGKFLKPFGADREHWAVAKATESGISHGQNALANPA